MLAATRSIVLAKRYSPGYSAHSAVRDNLRHASISTTSIYVHTDDVKQERQFGQAFTD
jgi:hypothetical protein